MEIVKNLKADLGGTDISSPLKEIFNSKDYDDINLARNLFILTDGEVNNREECLGLISTYSEKFKVHAIGIGSSFDKQLIQNAGIQGRGTYHFVANVSDVNQVIIESLSKCLRSYVTNAKLSLNELQPEQDFTPKMNFIYPDEILNYYFILKGKDHDKIQINFENPKKNENFVFTNDKIIKEEDGEIIGQIIVGNKLKNEENMEEETIIKLSKEYQILSKKTSLFAVAENEENNKIGELKQITKKKKKGLFDDIPLNNKNNLNFGNALNYDRAMNFNVNNYKSHSLSNNKDSNFKFDRAPLSSQNNNINSSLGINYCMAAPKSFAFKDDDDSDDEPKYKAKKCKKKSSFKLSQKIEKAKEKREEEAEELGAMDMDVDYCKNALKEYEMIGGEDRDEMGKNENSAELEEKEPEKEMKKEEEKKIEFSNKELVLTQDIFDGCWNLNPQTKLLIEKEKEIYDKIEGIMKEKNIDKEEVKITLLVLYYLNSNNSINKVEHMLIIKKGISFLEENGIKFDDIFTTLKN